VMRAVPRRSIVPPAPFDAPMPVETSVLLARAGRLKRVILCPWPHTFIGQTRADVVSMVHRVSDVRKKHIRSNQSRDRKGALALVGQALPPAKAVVTEA
jgi:hypothetical protein